MTPGKTIALMMAVQTCFAMSGAFALGTYREPSATVTRLLTAEPPPVPLVHARSRRVALLHQQPLVPIEWLARPYLGLAGFRFDPETRTSRRRGSWIIRVDVITVSDDGEMPSSVQWLPAGGGRLEDVAFSPDGRHLSATVIGAGPARLAVFDIDTGSQRVLSAPINAAWGEPCAWIGNETLLCRLVPEDPGPPPALQPGPVVVEHIGPPEPARTYPDLLEDESEDALFEHYFATELARVDVDGSVDRMPKSGGLLAEVEPSPDGRAAVVTRIVPPYSRLMPASRFPRSVEAWDLQEERLLGARAFTSRIPWRAVWKPDSPAVLGWIDRDKTDGLNRWLSSDSPHGGPPRQIVATKEPIRGFGWTTAGTPYFRTITHDGRNASVFVVVEGNPRKIWSGATEDRYGNPGRAIRVDGANGPVLELNGNIYFAGDGLGTGGPEPYLEAFDLLTGKIERIFTSAPGVFEPVLALLAANPPWLLTSRETETEPPNLFSVRITNGAESERRPVYRLANPYPGLETLERRILSYQRKDGVDLSATLYLPANDRAESRPTLIWIYPREYTEREYAEQIDIRAYRFPVVNGPSPLAAALAGYAVVLNPTMPIVGAEGQANDEYLPQLIQNAEAIVEHLVSIGVSDRKRIAIGGRSYGAFSTANLLAHTQLMRTGIAMSGAYNRTLTPFGFQHERRSFWKETDLYTRMSPFFYADQVDEPLLLIHGGADANPGTRPEQTRRFFQALVGNGGTVRFVELPHEDHVYTARESVLHAAAEMLDWLDRTIGSRSSESPQEAGQELGLGGGR